MLKKARRIINIELEAVSDLLPRLGENFIRAVELISQCKGKVVITGMGKSGLIGRKMAATFASTGTPATYLHPAEGKHGDVGIIMKQDIVIAISYSGETEELSELIPVLKKLGVQLITLTGDTKSTLAKTSEVILSIKVKKEACPYNLAPTASTTATLVLGDALALCVLDKKGIKQEDFALLHPGGAIGKRLLPVKDIMRTGKDNPVILQDKTVKDALLVMTSSRLGAVNVVDRKGILTGFFTDGDLRRHLQNDPEVLKKKISEVMTPNPFTITPRELATVAVGIIQKYNFDNLPVVDKKKKPVGIVDERDLLARGIN